MSAIQDEVQIDVEWRRQRLDGLVVRNLAPAWMGLDAVRVTVAGSGSILFDARCMPSDRAEEVFVEQLKKLDAQGYMPTVTIQEYKQKQ